MSSVINRFLRITAMLLIYALLTLSAFNFLSLAQEPSAFEIRVVSQAEYAVAGQPFTYTIVITNVRQMPVKDVIVLTETPTGAAFVGTHQNANWLIGGVRPGETGVVVWNTLEPIAPAQPVIFELIVNVLPEMVNQPLISKEYMIMNKANGDVIATGLPVTTQVLATNPTATPSPTPTATTTRPPTPTATSSPTSTSIPTPTPQAESPIAHTPTPIEISPVSEASSSISIVPVIFGLLIVGGGVIGLIWFFKRKKQDT